MAFVYWIVLLLLRAKPLLVEQCPVIRITSKCFHYWNRITETILKLFLFLLYEGIFYTSGLQLVQLHGPAVVVVMAVGRREDGFIYVLTACTNGPSLICTLARCLHGLVSNGPQTRNGPQIGGWKPLIYLEIKCL